jgi:hypothetical protein
MKSSDRHPLKTFALELAIYALLVSGYFFLVLHFLGAWLRHLFDANKGIYAVVAVALIVGQGVMLEMLTTWLLRFLRSKLR